MPRPLPHSERSTPGPRLVPGSINLAIALLNQGGEAADKAKGSGQDDLEGAPKLNIDEANQLLDDVIIRQPSNPWALFSRGIILQFKGRLEEAHRDFKKVTEIDPTDANAWLELGGTLTDPDRPGMKAGKARPANSSDSIPKPSSATRT